MRFCPVVLRYRSHEILWPENETSDLYSGEEGGGVFCVSCGDAAPSFQVQESVFDEVTKFVEFFITRLLNETVFLGGMTGSMFWFVA